MSIELGDLVEIESSIDTYVVAGIRTLQKQEYPPFKMFYLRRAADTDPSKQNEIKREREQNIYKIIREEHVYE